MTSTSHATDGPALRIGTRGSALARWQADWVAERLRNFGRAVELVEISTHGDRQQTGSLGTLGGEGLFTKELQRALLSNQVDLAVHSLKDLPTTPVTGLKIAAVPPRANPADVLVSRTEASLDKLPAGARVGTGSLRRAAQLLAVRPDLKIEGIRGNVDTRLSKLDDGAYDALVLAAAGLERLGLADRVTEVLSADIMLSAVGQGALGIECRADDEVTYAALKSLDDELSHLAVGVERKLLAALGAGCSAPVGALARCADEQQIELAAVVLSHDGSQRLFHRDRASWSDAEVLGVRVADVLLAEGARELIESARRQ